MQRPRSFPLRSPAVQFCCGIAVAAFSRRTLLLLLLLLSFAAYAGAGTSYEGFLYSFCSLGQCADGQYPYAGLIRDAAGNLYGTTQAGGANGDGTVFKLDNTGHETVLYSFCTAPNCTDGFVPYGGLIQDAAGNLYGTTEVGGNPYNGGTVFELTPTAGGVWTETVLYSFCSAPNCPDGDQPYGGLIQDAAGNLYGTTYAGGANGNGTVFELTPTAGGRWTENVLYSFCSAPGCTDGSGPLAGLIRDAAGNLYGTTHEGGANGYGTVFKVDNTGHETWHYSFCSAPSCADGAYPFAGLIQDAAGNLFGTTARGGNFFAGGNGAGTVFKVDNTGHETVLYTFCSASNCADGSEPDAGLIQDAAGNLFGTTAFGGVHGQGTVFTVGYTGPESVLYSFCSAKNCTDGANPQAGLIQDAAGNLYGTTLNGGANNGGTVFGLEAAANYTLTVSTSGNGTVASTDGFINCPGTCSHSYTPNTQVTLNAAPAAGWTLSGWSGACSGTGACVVTMTQDLSVGATFTQLSYILMVSTSGQGTVTSTDGFINCPGMCSHSYLSNTQVTMNATPAAGWTFSGWSGGCTGTGSCLVTMTQNLSVGATFTELFYTLTLSTIGNGTVTSTDGFINCPGTCSHSYLSNTQVTLNATPSQGWTFVGWNGACSGTGSCTVTMTQSLSVNAIFAGNGALQFVAVTPCRLVDTRLQNGGSGPIQGGTSQAFALPQLAQSRGCADLSSAAAYSLNVTVVPPGPLGYLTIWPTGENQPVVSTLNSLDGRVKANAAIVPAGTSGAVSVFVSNTSDVVLDIDGYFAPVSNSTLAFYPLTPCRVADTRSNNYPQGLGAPSLNSGVRRDFPILSSQCGIPNTAQAYSLNFTAVPLEPLGYLTVWPAGQNQPVVSTLNDVTGTVVANAAIVPAGAGGDIDAFASNNTDVVIDINGYFAPPGQNGLSLYAVAPCRVLDTRPPGGNGQFVDELTVDVVDSACGPPRLAQAYVFNATVVPPAPLGYLTLWPDGGTQPGVSTLNALDGAITSNMAIVPTTNGKIDAFASNLTQLVLDISAYFAP